MTASVGVLERGAALVSRRALPAWMADAAGLAALVALQVLLVAPLFAGPFTQMRGSIEATFIANALFIAQSFPDITWYPNWYLGFPFELHYTPLLPAVVALLGTAIDDVPSAYRIVAATGYVLGPAGVYVLARMVARSRLAGLGAGLAFTLLPSLSYAFPTLLADGQDLSGSAVPAPWRLVVLVRYGEGPHVLSLSLALFATAALVSYLRRPTSGRLALTVSLLVAVAMTNLIGAFGVALLVLGIAIAPSDVVARTGRWQRLARVGILTIVFSLAWYSVGFMLAFSKPSGGDSASGYALLGVALSAIWAVTRIPALARLPRGLDLALIWTVLVGAIVAVRQITGVAIAPQPIRYSIEADAAFAIALGIGFAIAREHVRGPRARRALVAAAVAAAVIGIPGWLGVSAKLAPAADWQDWSERRVALWLADRSAPGERVYATGGHAFWLNVFADVPQVRGGQDFSAVDPWPAHAAYQINTGADTDISVLWLRALGVRYVVVPGPGSTEVYRDFASPSKFDGVLPMAFEERGVRIYEVPPAGAAPAVTLTQPSLAPPRNGIDRDVLATYVGELERSRPGAVERIGQGALRIAYDAAPGEMLLVREAADSGWRASIEGYPIAIDRDALGQMLIRVPAGRHVVELERRVHVDLLLGLLVAIGTGLLLTLRPLLRAHRVRLSVGARVILGAGAVTATAVTLGLALGAWTGFPKGADAANHLTRLRFVADNFPYHDWLYMWSAGMPAFDNYPGLPYVMSVPLVRTIGAEPTLQLLALLATVALGLGIYGHVLERGRGPLIAALAALLVITSMSVWHFAVAGGVYARVIAIAPGAIAWWAHARAMRTGRGRWLALTAVLIALSIASHQVTGAFVALYIAAVHLSTLRLRGLPSLAVLAGLSALLSAQPMVSPMLLGLGGRILGVDRPELSPTSPDALWSPLHMGVAALSIPLLAIAIASLRSPVRALAALVPIGLIVAYIYAPNLGVPTRYYYINGIDPPTVTYFLAIVGALVFAVVAPSSSERRGRLLAGVGAVAIMLNTIVAVPAMRQSPFVNDISAPWTMERVSRETIVVDGDDVRHRILPLTASEQVWFNYAYAKPSLRDYYTFGIVHKDWNFWAFDSVYKPPVPRERLSAILDWFALDTITVPWGDRPKADEAFSSSTDLALVASTRDRPFRQYTVVDPTPIVVTSTAPIVAVVASATGYDQRARVLFDEGASPRTRTVVWWPGTLADLPADLRVAAASVLVVGDRLGDGGRAAEVAGGLATRGARVVWDVDGVASGPLPAPWPVASIAEMPISRWDVTDARGRITREQFGPAEYDGGAWNAPVGERLADGAISELDLAGRPLIASRALGTGTLTVLGGNLLYHTLDKGSDAERAYVVSFLGPQAHDAASEPVWRFVHPGQREVETDGSAVVLKESYYPKWSARWSGADGTARDLEIRYAGPGLMLVVPPGPGTVVFEYQPTQWSGWVAWALTALGVGAALLVARRRGRVVPEPAGALPVATADAAPASRSWHRPRLPSWLDDDPADR